MHPPQMSQYKAITDATPAQPVVNKPHTDTVQGHVEKAAPGKDVFADHPHLDIKSDSRPAPPQAAPKDPAVIAQENVQVNENPLVGEPKTEAKKAPEIIKTAGQPGAPKEETVATKPDIGEKVLVIEVPEQEVKKVASTTAEAGAVKEAVSVKEAAAVKETAPATETTLATEAAPVPAARPLLEEDVEADRVAAKLYDAGH